MTEPAPTPFRARLYSAYLVVMMGLATLVAAYDHNLLNILVEPIKRDLRLTDSEIGLLNGLGFAVPYCFLAIPIGRLADRTGRAKTMAAVLAIWSLMTALSGRAMNFSAMLACRVGVGIGEAGATPVSHALIADHFNPRVRGKALAGIVVCGAIGYSLAFGAGGVIADHWSWRAAYYAGGIPGLALAILVLFTIKENRAKQQSLDAAEAQESLTASLGILWKRKSYVFLTIGMSIAAIGGFAIQAWGPALLMRNYGATTSQVGAFYSAIVAPATVAAVVLSGFLNDYLVSRDQRWPLWLLAIAFLIACPALLAFPWMNSLSLALSLSLINLLAIGLWFVPAYAFVQSISEARCRAMSSAIFVTVVNGVGMGLGPYLAGLLSDALTPAYGTKALGVGLTILSPTYVIGAACFLIAARTASADVAAAAKNQQP